MLLSPSTELPQKAGAPLFVSVKAAEASKSAFQQQTGQEPPYSPQAVMVSNYSNFDL